MRIQSLQEFHFFFPDMDGFWNVQNLSDTEHKIRSLLPTIEAAHSPQQLETMTQLARVLGLQAKVKEAHEVLDFVSAQIKNLNSEEKVRPEIRFFLEKGRLSGLSMSPSQALGAFGQAWTLAKEFSLDVFAIDAAYMISITLPAKEKKKWLLQAGEIAEKSNDPLCKNWLTYLYILDGWHAFDNHDFQTAFSTFEKASRVCDGIAPQETFQKLKWYSARSLRALGRNDESLKIQEGILSELELLGRINGHVYLEIAECLQALRQSEKARTYYELAYESLKKDNWYSDNQVHELSRIQKNSKK